jgi:hypothetical protein
LPETVIVALPSPVPELAIACSGVYILDAVFVKDANSNKRFFRNSISPS